MHIFRVVLLHVATFLVLLCCAVPVMAAQSDPTLWIYGSPEAIRAAIRPGDINIRDNKGKTPLMYAAEHNSPAAVLALLEMSADPNSRTVTNVTPLMFAAMYSKTSRETISILLRFGAAIDAVDNKGRSALILAAYSKEGREEALITLLENGANPFLIDHEKRKALDYARNNIKLIGTNARTMLVEYSDSSKHLYRPGVALPPSTAETYTPPGSTHTGPAPQSAPPDSSSRGGRDLSSEIKTEYAIQTKNNTLAPIPPTNANGTNPPIAGKKRLPDEIPYLEQQEEKDLALTKGVDKGHDLKYWISILDPVWRILFGSTGGLVGGLYIFFYVRRKKKTHITTDKKGV